MNTSLIHVEREPQHLPSTLDKIETAIALAKTPEEINGVLALMDAAVAYAKRFYKDQQDIIQRAKALRLQAERRLGELLRAMPKRGPEHSTGGGSNGSKREPLLNAPPTLNEIGIDKKTSMRAQRLAALPEKKFAAVVAGEIPVAKAIATPPKKATAKTKAQEHIQQHKAVVATEGSTYLIVTLRSAYNAIEAAGDSVEERDRAIAMARKLAASLNNFIEKFQGVAGDL